MKGGYGCKGEKGLGWKGGVVIDEEEIEELCGGRLGIWLGGRVGMGGGLERGGGGEGMERERRGNIIRK
jgi:hypothetical protein